MATAPPLNALRAFEAAARLQSLTRAAQELHVSQAAVSRHVRKLEQFLEVQLFIRTSSAITLTREGAMILPVITKAFAEIWSAVESVNRRNRRNRREVLCIQAYSAFAQRWLIPRIPQFQRQYPKIELRLTSGSSLPSFESTNLDAWIRVGEGNWSDLTSLKLVPLELLPVCRPDLVNAFLKQEGGPGSTLLHSMARPNDWATWLRAANISSIDPYSGMKFQHSGLAFEAALNGAGVAIGQRALVEQNLRDGTLVAPHELILPISSAYYLVYPVDKRVSKSLKLFHGWLVENIGSSWKRVGES